MLTAAQLREHLKKENPTQLPEYNSELLKLYSLRPSIESTVSAMLLENVKPSMPNIEGIRFYDNVFGEQFDELRKSLNKLYIEEVADHICNWFYLNGYYARFKIEIINDEKHIHFLIKFAEENTLKNEKIHNP